MPSVTSVTADPREFPGYADNNGEVRFYLVEFDAKGFTKWDARNATGVPVDGTPLSEGSNLLVTYKRAEPHPNSPRVVVVEVRWTVPQTGFTIFQPQQPPGASKWNISAEAEGVSFTEDVYVDRNGVAIQNSAFYKFNPSLVKEYFDELVTVSYTTDAANLSSWDDEIPPARGKVSSDSVTLTVGGLTRTFPAGSLKLGNARYGVTQGLSDTGVLEQQFRVQLPLLYRADGWTRKIVDKGFYEFDSESLEWTPILDATGQMVTEPVYLNGAGQKLDPSEDVEPVLLEFDVEDEVAFNPFLADIG